MQCPSCSAGNPDGMRYCGQCASPLPLCCPACGFANPAGFSFCGQCGGALPAASEAATAPSPGEDRHAGADAERRPLTVLFCDLVGSTALSERLDPEELMALVRRYQQACTEVIERFEGHIAQYLGDGLLVYFGFPLAHEDDAARAVRTALGIFEAMARLSREAGTTAGEGVAVRIGVHTGTVVVGEMGSGPRRERLALGQSPNVAARLQGLAEPGTVLTSGATYQLVTQVFDGEPLGRHRLKEISEPVEVVRILGERGAASRPQDRGPTPLVGRRRELATLLDGWRAARRGASRIVLLEGEAGMGKTRLVDRLFEELAGEHYRRCEGFCSPYYRNTALYPVIDLLHRELGFEVEEAPEGEESRLERLEEALSEAGFPVADSLPLWAGLLGVSVEGGRHRASPLPPQRQRQALLAGLVNWLLRQAVEQPLLFVVHDTHWIDPTTVELLSALAGRLAEAPVLLLLTYRPGFSSPFPDPDRLTHLTLANLERQEVQALVRSLAGDRELAPEILDRLVERSDGVPLYVEEMTRSLLESDLLREGTARDAAAYAPAIPATLESSLMARLDRLGTARETAQVASILGRRFELELLREIWPRDPAALDLSLDRLQEAQLVHREPAAARSTYVFRHALIQEAAYESLLLVERRRYHGRAAEALQRRFGAPGGPRPELLAHHFTAAGRAAEAIGYWQRAGQDALARSANVEAARHLESGLELVPRLAEPSRRPAVELELQTLLGPALMASQGYASPAVAAVYRRARELAEEGGAAPQRIQVFLGLAQFHGARAELEPAIGFGRQLLEISEQAGDTEHVLEAHRYLGAISFHQGALADARRHLLAAIALSDPEEYHSRNFLEDTEVFCGDYLAWTLWHLGHPGQALERSYRSLARARALAHPFTEAHALGFLAVLHQFRREPVAARQRAEELCTLSEKHGFPHRLAMGLSVRGWALAEEGRLAEGIEEMERGLQTWRATRATILVPQLLTYLAGAHHRHGDGERCLQLLAEAEALAATTQDRFFDPELLRLRGLALRDRGDAAAAVAGFERGLEAARDFGNQALVLRCATALAEAWRQRGREPEARRLLEEVTALFEEGLDSADLAAARQLLAAGA